MLKKNQQKQEVQVFESMVNLDASINGLIDISAKHQESKKSLKSIELDFIDLSTFWKKVCNTFSPDIFLFSTLFFFATFFAWDFNSMTEKNFLNQINKQDISEVDINEFENKQKKEFSKYILTLPKANQDTFKFTDKDAVTLFYTHLENNAKHDLAAYTGYKYYEQYFSFYRNLFSILFIFMLTGVPFLKYQFKLKKIIKENEENEKTIRHINHEIKTLESQYTQSYNGLTPFLKMNTNFNIPVQEVYKNYFYETYRNKTIVDLAVENQITKNIVLHQDINKNPSLDFKLLETQSNIEKIIQLASKD